MKENKSFPSRERGLKSSIVKEEEEAKPVVPLAGTWIEIAQGQ